MDEYLDIIDDDDNVIGSDTRKNVHANYHIHRGVHVIVLNAQGEVALQRRSLAKDYYPGYLDISVGAQVASGETYDGAAVRELAEELGCVEHNLIHIADYDAFSPRQREKRRVFVHRCDGPFTPDPAEVAEVFFTRSEEVQQLLQSEKFTEGAKKTLCLFAALANHGKPFSRQEAARVLAAAGLTERSDLKPAANPA